MNDRIQSLAHRWQTRQAAGGMVLADIRGKWGKSLGASLTIDLFGGSVMLSVIDGWDGEGATLTYFGRWMPGKSLLKSSSPGAKIPVEMKVFAQASEGTLAIELTSEAGTKRLELKLEQVK